MTATPEAPAVERSYLVARRPAADARPDWWGRERWAWLICAPWGEQPMPYWTPSADEVPEPPAGLLAAVAGIGEGIGERTVCRRVVWRYLGELPGCRTLVRVPELHEEHAWPLVRLAPSVEDAAPADVVGGARRGP